MSTAVARKPKTAKTAADPVRDAIGITALAKSQKPDNHRNLLEPGWHEVRLAIIGTVDGNWSRRCDGSLVIAPDSCAGSLFQHALAEAFALGALPHAGKRSPQLALRRHTRRRSRSAERRRPRPWPPRWSRP